MKISLNKDLLEAIGIPKKFWALGRDTYFGNQNALRVVEEYIVNFTPEINFGLLFRGLSCTLKTFLLTYTLKCLTSNALTNSAYPALYATLPQITNCYFNRAEFYYSLKTAFIAGIDELEFTSNEGEKQVLERLLQTRSDWGLPTLIATSLDAAKIQAIYGQRSNILIRNNFKEVRCSVDSDRLKNALEKRRLLYA
jgi:hypothetical protein